MDSVTAAQSPDECPRVTSIQAADDITLLGIVFAHEAVASAWWAYPNSTRHHCVYCYYCRVPLPTRHEHDHYPMPERAGGKRVVPVCLTCHDLKDRASLKQWPEPERKAAFDELLREHYAEVAQLAVQHGGLDLELIPTHDLTLALTLPTARWELWSPLARLLAAKLLSLAFDGDDPRIPRQPVPGAVADCRQHSGA